MKSFFENNRAYFEKTGKAQTLKKATVGDCAAGVASSARARGKKTGLNMCLGHLKWALGPQIRTCDETGVPLSQHLGSQNSPDWMNTARKWTSPQTPRRNGEREARRHSEPQSCCISVAIQWLASSRQAGKDRQGASGFSFSVRRCQVHH